MTPKRKHRPDHFWDQVKNDYQNGMPQPEIIQKYKLKASTLSMRIKRDGWKISQEQSHALTEFSKASVNLSEKFVNASQVQKEEMIERTRTILQDNQLIQNNRALLSSLQGAMSRIIREGAIQKMADIKAGTSAIRDIEAVANPKPETSINIDNQVAIPTQIIFKPV